MLPQEFLISPQGKKHNSNKPICQCPTKTGEISVSEQFTSVFPVVCNLILNEQENKRSETTENIKSNGRFFSTFDMDKLGKIGRHHRKRSALMLLSPLPHPPSIKTSVTFRDCEQRYPLSEFSTNHLQTMQFY